MHYLLLLSPLLFEGRVEDFRGRARQGKARQGQGMYAIRLMPGWVCVVGVRLDSSLWLVA